MAVLGLILLIAAAVCFTLSALEIKAPQLDLTALGLALLAMSLLAARSW